ncbi:MAG: hypothetical protein ACRC20_05870 [Segniliparus sp.]|uniref:hypothetical protein n=1 Tax=Segniliparus sp. TaxID=2804064 RepID=UPI003F4018F5
MGRHVFFEEIDTPPTGSAARRAPLRKRSPQPHGYQKPKVEHKSTVGSDGRTTAETTHTYTPKDPWWKRTADTAGHVRDTAGSIVGTLDQIGNLKNKAGQVIRNADGSPGPAANELPEPTTAPGGAKAPSAADETGWGTKDRPGGSALPSDVQKQMDKHELPNADDARRDQDNKAAQDAKTGKDILADDGFVEFVMGWSDFANKNKAVLGPLGYVHSDNAFGAGWEAAKDALSGVTGPLFGWKPGEDSMAPALYAMYHWEDQVSFAGIQAHAGLAEDARDMAQDGAQRQASDMGSMGEAWVGEGGDAAQAHYGTNRGKSAAATIDALKVASLGLAATGHNIAELLDMKKPGVEDIAQGLKGAVGGHTEDDYQKIIDLLQDAEYVAEITAAASAVSAGTAGAAVVLAGTLLEVGIAAADFEFMIERKTEEYLQKLVNAAIDEANKLLQGGAGFVTDAWNNTIGSVTGKKIHIDVPTIRKVKEEESPGVKTARKLQAKLDELRIDNVIAGAETLVNFVKALRAAENGITALCAKVHQSGKEVLEKLPPDPGAPPTVLGDDKPPQAAVPGPGGGGPGAGGGSPSGGGVGAGSGKPAGSGLANGRSDSGAGSHGASSGAAGGAGDIGQALGSAGQALGSVGQALGQAVSGLGSALGGALQGLMGSVGQIIQTAAQAAQQQQDKDKKKDDEKNKDEDEKRDGEEDKDGEAADEEKASGGEREPDHASPAGASLGSGPAASSPAASAIQAGPALATAPAGLGHAAQSDGGGTVRKQTANDHGDFEVQANVRQAMSNQGHLTGFE